MPANKKPKSKSATQKQYTRSATPRKTARQGKNSDKELGKRLRGAIGDKAVSVKRERPLGARPKNSMEKLTDLIGKKQIRTGKPVPKPSKKTYNALRKQKKSKKSGGKGLGATGLRDKSSVISRRIKKI